MSKKTIYQKLGERFHDAGVSFYQMEDKVKEIVSCIPASTRHLYSDDDNIAAYQFMDNVFNQTDPPNFEEQLERYGSAYIVLYYRGNLIYEANADVPEKVFEGFGPTNKDHVLDVTIGDYTYYNYDPSLYSKREINGLVEWSTFLSKATPVISNIMNKISIKYGSFPDNRLDVSVNEKELRVRATVGIKDAPLEILIIVDMIGRSVEVHDFKAPEEFLKSQDIGEHSLMDVYEGLRRLAKKNNFPMVVTGRVMSLDIS